eukprot:TRINITY_DN12551_c0_g1_i1.p1 TRINITY_DN12551_c0_g1~~TRINITY_DN12551_c0_g1_i1.p1  ORF type:complete len:544 (+),score=102.70 TRINITY_DN12551_c0_g1_i1:67-1698(+)
MPETVRRYGAAPTESEAGSVTSSGVKRRRRRWPHPLAIAAAVLYVLYDLAVYQLPRHAALYTREAEAGRQHDLAEILANGTLMCDYFSFAPEPFWISILKTLVQYQIMDWLANRHDSESHWVEHTLHVDKGQMPIEILIAYYPKGLTVFSFLFVLYQCLAVGFTVVVAYSDDRLDSWLLKLWGLMYSSSVLSLLTIALKLYVEQHAAPEDCSPDVRANYPGLLPSNVHKPEVYQNYAPEDGASEEDEAPDVMMAIPRKLCYALIGLVTVPLIPGFITHCGVGTLTCAFPLLWLLPALYGLTPAIQGHPFPEQLKGKVPKKGCWLWVVIFMFLFGVYVAYYRYYLGVYGHDIPSMPRPNELGPFVLIGDCGMYCFLFFAVVHFLTNFNRISRVCCRELGGALGMSVDDFGFGRAIPWGGPPHPYVAYGRPVDGGVYRENPYPGQVLAQGSVSPRGQSREEKWRNKHSRRQAMQRQLDAVLRAFLLTVFIQGSASYAALLYAGSDYWKIVDTEWHSREWHAHLACAAEKGSGNNPLGLANLIGTF